MKHPFVHIPGQGIEAFKQQLWNKLRDSQSALSYGLALIFSSCPYQVINGQIVVDTSSLTVQAQQSDDVTTYTRVEEDARLINTQSYMKKTSG